MTQYFALTVILENHLSEEETKPLIQSIEMMRGVADVQPQVSDEAVMLAEQRSLQQVCDLIDTRVKARRQVAV